MDQKIEITTPEGWTRTSRIVLPRIGESDTFPLYVDFGRPLPPIPPLERKKDDIVEPMPPSSNQENVDGLINADGTFTLKKGMRVSFATLFNGFPASYWQRWTEAQNVRLSIIVDAQTDVMIYKSNDQGRSQVVDSMTAEGEISIEMPLKTFADGGWYWFDVIAKEDTVIRGGQWAVDCLPKREATTTIGITTFNRPDYCARTILRLGEAENLKEIVEHVYVVDQGNQKVVDDDLYPKAAESIGSRLSIIDQPNLGGSGGFSRGMYESINRAKTTFHLLLDDDIIVDPESIERLVTFGSLCTDPTIVGGQMFDINDRSVVHSFGEGINRYRWLWGPVESTENRVDLAAYNLRQRPVQHRRLDVDYNGWWMELIPLEVINKIGLSLPIFIKWDDLEYSLRAEEAGYRTVTLPGAGIWHMSWLDKDDSRDWQAYFHERNRILTALLHSPYERGGRLQYELTTMDVKHSISSEYYAQTARLQADKDILAGPQHLHGTIGKLVPELRAMTNDFTDAQYKPEVDMFPRILHGKPKYNKIPEAPTKLTLIPWTIKTLVRQFLPPSKKAKEHPEAELSHEKSKFYVLSQYDSVLVSKADGSGRAWYKRDPKKLRELMAESSNARAKLFIRWKRLSKLYKEALPSIVSPEAWEKTFGITDSE